MASNSAKNSSLSSSNKQYYELFIFAALMFQFMVLCPSIQQLNPFAITPYFLSYQDFGFNSRLFVGSIIKLFSEYISSSAIYYCIVIVIIGMNALVAATLGKVLRRSPADGLDSMKIFLFLFLSSPFSLSFLFYGENFGRFDTYLVIITVVMMLIVRRKYLRWLVPLLCVIAVAIYQGYIMLYMPVIAIILVYECYKNKFALSSLLLCGSSFVLVNALSIYCQYFTPRFDFKDAEAVVEYLAHRTDFKLSEIMIFTEYFINVVNSFSYQVQIVKAFALPYTVSVLIMTSPLIMVFISLWSLAFRTARDRFSRFIVLLCIVAPLMSLPTFIGNDWDRWISAVFITQFALSFYLMDSGFDCVSKSAEKISSYFTTHKMLLVFILIFLSVLMFSVSRFLFMILQQSVADIYYAMLEEARSLLD